MQNEKQWGDEVEQLQQKHPQPPASVELLEILNKTSNFHYHFLPLTRFFPQIVVKL
jgi:hypothetical protein